MKKKTITLTGPELMLAKQNLATASAAALLADRNRAAAEYAMLASRSGQFEATFQALDEAIAAWWLAVDAVDAAQHTLDLLTD